jgi:hypothetical protein
MEQFVVSLETARKLKAAGFDQRTAWAWHRDQPSGENDFHLRVVGPDAASDGELPAEGECFAAPTADELAAQMSDDGFALLRLPRTPSPRYRVNSYTRSSEADTMAEALAALYLRQHEAPGDETGRPTR